MIITAWNCWDPFGASVSMLLNGHLKLLTCILLPPNINSLVLPKILFFNSQGFYVLTSPSQQPPPGPLEPDPIGGCEHTCPLKRGCCVKENYNCLQQAHRAKTTASSFRSILGGSVHYEKEHLRETVDFPMKQ